jgi:phosphoenolpyruvate---glycerone phosphotransferase subunit DhaL
MSAQLNTPLGALLDAACATLIAHADELTHLDQAVGDGDHGVNMRRGAEAVLAAREEILAKPLPAALQAIGMKLVMTVGGASGPLYGTLLMTLGKAVPAAPALADLGPAVQAALAAVQARGKSEPGQKTLLDVLAPMAGALQAGTPITDLPALAQAAAEATVPLRAIRGRASFLGERSVGHMDPGARSLALVIAALVGAWKDAA